MDYGPIRCLPGTAKISRQEQICNAYLQRVFASPGCSDLKTFEFNMLFTANTATNFNNMHLSIPMQIKKKSNIATDIDYTLMTGNNAYFMKKIDIKRYVDDIKIILTNNTVDVYRYSDAMLKHMSEDTFKNTRRNIAI